MYERRRARILLAVLALVSLVLLTISARAGEEGPLASIRDGVMTVFGPLQDGLASVTRPVGGFFSGVGDLFELRAENARLEQRLEALETRRRAATDIERENERLREQLEMREDLTALSEDFEFLSAQVIAFPTSDFEWTVIVDAGSQDGVETNMTVVTGEGLVGRVIQVGTRTSRVLLAVDPNFGAAVRVVESGEYGYVTGGDTEPMPLRLFDPEAPVEPGDEVVTSTYRLDDFAGVFPDGIPVGIVDSVGEATGSLTREVRVRPFVDFTRLQVVDIVLREPPPEPVDLPTIGAESGTPAPEGTAGTPSPDGTG